MVQLAGVAPPGLAMKPKLTEPPTGIAPFQPTLLKVKRWPLRVSTASHWELTAPPDGRSKASDQPLIAVGPPLVMTYLPSKADPQEEVLVKVAVAAALAGLATKGITTKASASEKTAVSVRQRYLRCMSQPLWDGWGEQSCGRVR